MAAIVRRRARGVTREPVGLVVMVLAVVAALGLTRPAGATPIGSSGPPISLIFQGAFGPPGAVSEPITITIDFDPLQAPSDVVIGTISDDGVLFPVTRTEFYNFTFSVEFTQTAIFPGGSGQFAQRSGDPDFRFTDGITYSGSIQPVIGIASLLGPASILDPTVATFLSIAITDVTGTSIQPNTLLTNAPSFGPLLPGAFVLDNGSVVISGTITNVLAAAVSEPETAALIVAGFGALGLFGWAWGRRSASRAARA